MSLQLVTLSPSSTVLWFTKQQRSLTFCSPFLRSPPCLFYASTRLQNEMDNSVQWERNYAWEGLANHEHWRNHALSSSLEDSYPIASDEIDKSEATVSKESAEELLSSDQLKNLLIDSERSKLLGKLSEANQQNRFLKRQLRYKEESLVNFKNELATLETEIQVLINLAEEISQYDVPEGSRRIDGKFIQSHMLSRLEAVHEMVTEQVKDVERAESMEVQVIWYGMAQSVTIMGTFDGWSQGQALSQDYDGSLNKFTTTLLLRPGRYEVKFLVDGEWQLSPQYPLVGEGLTRNNLLVVE